MISTMKTHTTSLLLLLVMFCSSTEARTRGASRQAPSLRERPARQAMESVEILKERRQCIPYSEVNSIVVESRYSKLEETCDPADCTGATSCCRLLSNSLVCDTDNEYPFSACVCNDSTRTLTPTQAPVAATSAPSPTPGATGGTDNGSTGGNNGSGTGTGNGSTGSGSDGNSGSGNNGNAANDNNTGGGNTGNTAADGNQDIVIVGDDNADTSGSKNDGGINQIKKEIQTTPEEEHWYEDPTIVGPIAAGVLVLFAGILLLTSRSKSHSRQSRPVKQLAWDADNGSDTMVVEKHVELESVQSDYQMNELPPEDEELSMADSSKEKKCCEPAPCHDFSSWIDGACGGPSRARSYDAKDTVVL